MIKSAFARGWSGLRPELLRLAALTLVASLLWCAFFDRWTRESWETPLTYLSDPLRGDVFWILAEIKAGSEAHIQPFSFNNVPELGAPYPAANWDDYPLTEKPLFCLTGLLARFMGIFAAANFAVMLAQVLAAGSFYVACRALGGAWPWCFGGALIFAFSRFAFAEGLHHLSVTWYWHIPLCLVVCNWLFRGQIPLSGPRLRFALAVAFVTGIQNIYYTGMFGQFLVFGSLVQAWRKGWRAALPGAAIIGTTLGAAALMNFNTLLHHVIHGGNEQAVIRSYRWLEIYGLKIVDLVMPPPDHPIPLLAGLGANHMREVLLSPGELPPSAYLGLIGLTAFAWLALHSLRCAVEGARLPLEAWLVLWIFLFASVGGVNGILGMLGENFFRATTRYSIFILCLALMFTVRRLSRQRPAVSVSSGAAAFLITLLALWEQTPPFVTARDWEATARAVASDRDFSLKIAQRLPIEARVFQLPIMAFPEASVAGVGSSEHFRPYLYTDRLRFSFGSDKGRPQADWQQNMVHLPLLMAIHRLESYGFSAIYVNGNGYAAKGALFMKAFQTNGYSDIVESADGDLFCVFLSPSRSPVLPQND